MRFRITKIGKTYHLQQKGFFGWKYVRSHIGHPESMLTRITSFNTIKEAEEYTLHMVNRLSTTREDFVREFEIIG